MSKVHVERSSQEMGGSAYFAGTMAAGVAEYDFPTNWLAHPKARFCIDWLFVILTTVSTVGNRTLRVGLFETTSNAWISSMFAGVVQVASATGNYLFAPGLAHVGTAVGTLVTAPWTPSWASADGIRGVPVIRLEHAVSASDTFTVGVGYRYEEA